jgi:uncharacterized protein (TIGR00251 family)
MIQPIDTPGGCRIRVRVTPGSRADALVGPHAGALKVSVTAPPERGKANQAVAALISEALKIPAARIAVVSGHASRDKTIEIAGLDSREVLARLAPL